jgi:hypothetical protein
MTTVTSTHHTCTQEKTLSKEMELLLSVLMTTEDGSKTELRTLFSGFGSFHQLLDADDVIFDRLEEHHGLVHVTSVLDDQTLLSEKDEGEEGEEGEERGRRSGRDLDCCSISIQTIAQSVVQSEMRHI